MNFLICFSRVDDDRGRQYELSKSAAKTMRGILFSWMHQIEKARLRFDDSLELSTTFLGRGVQEQPSAEVRLALEVQPDHW